jgi:hypothetical protein
MKRNVCSVSRKCLTSYVNVPRILMAPRYAANAPNWNGTVFARQNKIPGLHPRQDSAMRTDHFLLRVLALRFCQIRDVVKGYSEKSAVSQTHTREREDTCTSKTCTCRSRLCIKSVILMERNSVFTTGTACILPTRSELPHKALRGGNYIQGRKADSPTAPFATEKHSLESKGALDDTYNLPAEYTHENHRSTAI